MQVFKTIHDVLLKDQLILPSQVHSPPFELSPTNSFTTNPLVPKLLRCHTPSYLNGFLTGSLDEKRIRKIGFHEATSSPILIARTLSECVGTLHTAELALKHGLAMNTAGGTHHAARDSGSGFCILNDLAMTALDLLERRLVRKVLILDLDVHQGDGTAEILAGDARVVTVSVHCASNFPAVKQQSTVDVALEDRVGDDAYMAMLSGLLPRLLREHRPDLVLYDDGVDVHVDDGLGRLSLTDAGLARRAATVIDTCLCLGIPVAGFVGGGYADDLEMLARRHIHLHSAALTAWEDFELGRPGAFEQLRREARAAESHADFS